MKKLPIEKSIKNALGIVSPSRFYCDAKYRRKVIARAERRRKRKRIIKRVCKTALILSVILIILCFSSCDKITHGEVYSKEYKPAESKIMYIPIIHTNGEQTYTTIIPFYYHYPDRWEIDIRQPDGEGGYLTAEYYVDESVFDAIKIGDEFVYDSTRDYDEEPYTREKVTK